MTYLRAADGIGFVVLRLGQDEVGGTRLCGRSNAGRLGTPHLIECRRGRKVDDVHRRAGLPRERERAGGRHGLDVGWSRSSVVAW